MAKVLLVEDDERLIGSLKRWLDAEGHSVEHAGTGADALQLLGNFQYDIVVLDWGLPDGTGLDVLKKYRQTGGSTPVIFLTGESALNNKKQGLDSGADDYLTKPFEPDELSARIRTILRRPPGLISSVVAIKGVFIDTAKHTVTLAGESVTLGKREYAVLEFLLRNRGRAFSSQELLTAVWPSDSESTEDAVRTCLKKLRQKLTIDGQQSLINTVHGAGYMIDDN